LPKAAVKQPRVHLLDTRIGKTYNIPDAEVAQSVEQRTENVLASLVCKADCLTAFDLVVAYHS
jgi:hypothetical protein